jgi:hypothetical protein
MEMTLSILDPLSVGKVQQFFHFTVVFHDSATDCTTVMLVFLMILISRVKGIHLFYRMVFAFVIVPPSHVDQVPIGIFQGKVHPL